MKRYVVKTLRKPLDTTHVAVLHTIHDMKPNPLKDGTLLATCNDPEDAEFITRVLNESRYGKVQL